MSIAVALGIVAIVNLALGYALALAMEAERQAPTIVPLVLPPTTTRPAGASPLLPTLSAGAQAASTTTDVAARHELTAEPTSDDAQLAAKWSAELTDLASQMNQQPAAQAKVAAPTTSDDIETPIADPALSISELQPERVESSAETIAHCEHLLDETESLVRKHLLESESNAATDALGHGDDFTAAVDAKAIDAASNEIGSAASEGTTNDAAPSDATHSAAATPTYEPRQPRATLLDSAQLEATLNDWWQNDPSHTQPLCVAQIEIDNLRQLTADCGTLVAGNISRHLENLLLAVLRRDDSLATLGRSRFLAILPGVDAQAGVDVIEEARSRIESLEFVQSGRALLTTITAAIAQTSANESQEQLLARAAKALADARAAGRNRVAWHDGTQSRMHPATEAESRRQLVLQ